jgi:hypothetical protein
MRIGRRAPVLRTCQQFNSVTLKQYRIAPVSPVSSAFSTSHQCHRAPVSLFIKDTSNRCQLPLIQVSNVSNHRLAPASPLTTAPYSKPVTSVTCAVSPCTNVTCASITLLQCYLYHSVFCTFAPVLRCTGITLHQRYLVPVSLATSVDYPHAVSFVTSVTLYLYHQPVQPGTSTTLQQCILAPE